MKILIAVPLLTFLSSYTLAVDSNMLSRLTFIPDKRTQTYSSPGAKFLNNIGELVTEGAKTLAKQQAGLDDINRGLTEFKNLIGGARNAIVDNSDKAEDLARKIADNINNADTLKGNLENVKKQIDDHQRTLDALEGQRNAFKEKLKGLSKTTDNDKKAQEELTKLNDELTDKIREAEMKVSELDKQHKVLLDQKAQSKNALEMLEKQAMKSTGDAFKKMENEYESRFKNYPSIIEKSNAKGENKLVVLNLNCPSSTPNEEE